MASGVYLKRRHEWVIRLIKGGVPVQPSTGDRGPVMDALYDLVDAAGAVEFCRQEFSRVASIGQKEFEEAEEKLKKLGSGSPFKNWGGATTPAAYYAFQNTVNWARTVKDRFEERLLKAIGHDQDLKKTVQRIRQETAGPQLEDARELAGCGLHRLTPPYAGHGAKVEGSKLIYPIPDRVDNKHDFRANLRFDAGRHAEVLVEEYWEAVTHFMDRLLDVFYPAAEPAKD